MAGARFLGPAPCEPFEYFHLSRGAPHCDNRKLSQNAAKAICCFPPLWSPAGSAISWLLLDEQLKRIRRAGLPSHADVFCCISGPQHDSIRNFSATYEWVTVLHSTADESGYEGLTLTELFGACRTRPDLKAVAYIHTKGIRHFPNATPKVFKAVNSWRHFLK